MLRLLKKTTHKLRYTSLSLKYPQVIYKRYVVLLDNVVLPSQVRHPICRPIPSPKNRDKKPEPKVGLEVGGPSMCALRRPEVERRECSLPRPSFYPNERTSELSSVARGYGQGTNGS